MSATYTDYTASIRGLKQQQASLFLRLIADQMIIISTPNTPKDTGRLRADVVKQVLGLSGKVIWGKNYAQYQELKQFRKYTTPGTGPHFASNAANAVIDITATIAKKAGLL